VFIFAHFLRIPFSLHFFDCRIFIDNQWCCLRVFIDAKFWFLSAEGAKVDSRNQANSKNFFCPLPQIAGRYFVKFGDGVYVAKF